jgi:hypothetical protein
MSKRKKIKFIFKSGTKKRIEYRILLNKIEEFYQKSLDENIKFWNDEDEKVEFKDY